MDVQDGIYPVYVKDGVMYPIALTKEEYEMFNLTISLSIKKVKVLKDKPMGTAINLKKK